MASPWVLYERVPPEDLDKFFQQRDEAIGEASRLHSEFRVRNQAGVLRWCAADSVAGFDADGEDPITQMNLTGEDFATLGRWLRESGRPTAALLEGGYSDHLPELIDGFLCGWNGGE